MGRRKKQPAARMSVTTRSGHDGRRSIAPLSSLASTPELFAEDPETSPPPSPGTSTTPALPVPGSPSEDGLEDGPEPEPTLREVLKLMKVNHSDTMGKMEELKLDITIMRQDMHKMRDRVRETERRIGDLEDTVGPILPTIKAQGTKITSLEDKMDDLENRLRRNNLRLVGLPERVEGSDPVAFLESWFTQEFGNDCLSPCFVLERAHRVPGRPLPAGGPPHTMIMHLLNYRDRDSILRAARIKGSLKINNASVSLFPDYSPAVRASRAKYQHVKQKLREKTIQYSMLFPATLRVVHQGQVHFFQTPANALSWFESLHQPGRVSDRASDA